MAGNSILVRAVLGLLFAAIPLSASAVETAYLRTYAVKGAIEDIQQFVEEAVIQRGLAIAHRGDVGDMLQRTAKDVGASMTVYKEAHYLEFCSARFSRSAIEADPANLAFCPFVIFLYTLPADPGTVHVGYRRPPLDLPEPSGAAMREIDAMLDAIVKEGIE